MDYIELFDLLENAALSTPEQHGLADDEEFQHGYAAGMSVAKIYISSPALAKQELERLRKERE